jgi:ABC-2 type transport system ATP-binding protein
LRGAAELDADQQEAALLVQTDCLTKRYGPMTALDACSLSVERGEVLGLLGPNGSGKTTLLRLLLGYIRPTSGAASIDGHNCTRDSLAVRERVSYLPGEPRLSRRMRGRDVLRLFARLRKKGAAVPALQIAERLDLDTSVRVANMSTGMRQKLAIAIALGAEVPLYILDEPTSSLDPNVRQEIGRLVREARAAGKTVLFSSHVLSEVEAVCDRVAILRKGKLVHIQIMRELRRQHRIRARLTGELCEVPREMADEVSVERHEQGVVIDAPGELSQLLKWLADQPLAEVHVEPLGLRRVYERFHGE